MQVQRFDMFISTRHRWSTEQERALAKARRSGISVNKADVPVILAMLARDDRNHDVAAWFGLNQGRIKEVKDGQHGTPPLASSKSLPPSGSPGPKALALKAAIEASLKLSNAGKHSEAQSALTDALTEYGKQI